MGSYRKKSVVVEAVQFTGSNRREVLQFIYPSMSEDGLHGAEEMALPVVIGTLEGDMTVSPGDWIIRGVKGEVYPCKPDIFQATYEPVAACGRCGQPVAQPGMTRRDGQPVARAQWCDACLDRCHEATDFGHICQVCASPDEARRRGWAVAP
jgi:hypothetical protein